METGKKFKNIDEFRRHYLPNYYKSLLSPKERIEELVEKFGKSLRKVLKKDEA